ncbi:MAG TPA: efflux RND transporter periplasmic adaptor subunit [Longimicrobiales bacterium]|nr:efflux RND transporter periplasmic adaptor subunit [Longimicrobiales bacterium]
MKRIILLTATLGLAACASEEPGRLPRASEPVAVTVSQALRAPAVESFPASVTSERTAEIATRMSGTVGRVLVDVGSQVRRGQPLVELDANDVNARVAAARAQQELAQASHRRVDNLAKDGAASQQELDQATAALAAAGAMLAEAEAQEAYAVVRAPFDGVVTARNVDAGDLALPGQPLFVLVAPGALKVVADLPAQRSGALKVGDAVRVRLEGSDEQVQARVTRVVPALGGSSRTFRVEAVMQDAPSGAIPGAYARLEVVRSGEGPRWIPADAVVDRGQLTGVFAVEADTLRLRWVRLGQRRDGAVELLSGPAGADLTVVRRPTADLFDGRAVGQQSEERWTASGVAAAAAGEVVR